MKLVQKTFEEDQMLADRLSKQGISARLVKNGVIIEMPRNEDSSWTIVPGVNASLLIDVAEEGGAMTNTGSGHIVCGLHGQPLRPYRIPKGYSNGEHAFFSVPLGVVTVTGYHRGGAVEIDRHQIVVLAGTAHIQTTRVWEGMPDELPETFGHFEKAVKAAAEKGDCYHCRHVHFAAERK